MPAKIPRVNDVFSVTGAVTVDKNSPGCVQVQTVLFAMAVFAGKQDDLNENVNLG